MGRASRKHFSREFKLAALSRVQDGVRSMAHVAREVGVNPGTLRAWKRQLGHATTGGPTGGASAGASPGASEGMRGEVVRLRREVASLRQERDILKKAAAFFARDVS
jgi:transposase